MRLRHPAFAAAAAIALGSAAQLSLRAQQPPAPPTPSAITVQDLRDGLKNPARWLTFSGDYTGRRHSPLKQLTPQNVAGLVPQWMFQTDIPGFPGRGLEASPLVVDGVLYVTGNNNQAFAIDGRTGRPIWTYRRTLPANFSASVCCGPVNRGFALLGDRLYMGTLDAHLVALDRRTGSVIWDVEVGDLKKANAITAAPLAVKGAVIIGVAGGDFSSRGFIDAYDAQTGARLWRFNTIPDPGEPGSDSWPNTEAALRGGGAAWVTGSYDPALNLVYYGTGNPNPDYYGDDRAGDNLYTCSLVALDADTGKLRWHFQFTPHDIHDWDSAHVPVQADITIGGQLRPVVMVANRNGFFYTLDRETGKLLVARPFIDTSNWAKEVGPDGRPIVLDNIGTPDKCLPDNHGGTNFQPPTFDPGPRAVFRHGARNLRDLGRPQADAADRPGRAGSEWRPASGRRTRTMGGVARHRSDDRGTALGASLPVVPVYRVARPDGRPHVHRVGPRVHWRQRRFLLRVRGSERERTMEVSDRRARLGFGAGHLHAGRSAVGAHDLGPDVCRLRPPALTSHLSFPVSGNRSSCGFVSGCVVTRAALITIAR